MRAFVVVACLVGGVVCAEPDYAAMWDQFKADFGKVYDAAVEAQRFRAFKDNVDIIIDTNARNLSYELGLNQFADLTNEEFAAMHTGGYRPDARQWGEDLERVPFQKKNGTVPDSLDWVAKGGVTKVKNQQQCGSCWAFSTTGSLEGALFVASGKLVSLSEEDLVQCDKVDHGCQGGLMDNAFKFVKTKGICSEADYPYTSGSGSTGTCKTPACTPAARLTGYTDVPKNDEDALKQAVAEQPVSVAIEADKMAFQLYKKGVLSSSGCGTRLDHGVLVVGYGTDAGTDYWKVKNSWGATWGEQGYIRMARGKNECGIASEPSYPTGVTAAGPGPAPGPAPGPSPAATHYGDPANGCESDEVAVQIQGISGDVCSPKCGLLTKCPTDVPAGVTATPKCELRAGLFNKRCALDCDPSSDENQCGSGTCQSVASAGVGICTYASSPREGTQVEQATVIKTEEAAQLVV